MNSSILKKACSYCIYQERTQADVLQKLKEWKVYGDEADEILTWLITENFVNEGRYAKQFAGGKFRVKKWGRKKILYELKQKGISANCIKEAMLEITDEDYFDTLTVLYQNKLKSQLSENDAFKAKQRTVAYLLGKGYTYDEIAQTIKPE